jgi:sterol desaturase/sphingolipid hydroxylase (fatty acid hydroxylase superfamily)
MLATKFAAFSRYAVFPVLLIAFGALTFLMRDTAVARVFPYYYLFSLFFAMITIERVYAYKGAVSQRHMIWRDLMSTAVQTFIVGAVMGAIVLPVLHFFPNAFLGRRFFFALSDQLGPLWLQVLYVFLLSSLYSYWMHRYQHYNEFLWKLHGYHHGVTSLQTTNILVSNPLDFALRNVLGGLLLSVVGFNPIAVVIASGLNIYGYFSHSGGDMRGGWLSYFFNTPEVHRWHHSVAFPDEEKFRYGCNYGVGVSFWDVIFGTFYLPKDETGLVVQPARLGHPGGYPDEPNYLKMLLAVRAFPAIERLFDRRKDASVTVAAE